MLCVSFQLITLVIVDNKWATYVWDMKRRQLTIHAVGNISGEWDAYDRIAFAMTAALRRCIDAFFDGWSIDWDKWATVYKTASSRSEMKPNK